MSPEHVFFEGRRTALAWSLADEVDCYNQMVPTTQRIAEAEVAAVYQACNSGSSLRYPLSRLVTALERIALPENQSFAPEIQQARKKAYTVLEPYAVAAQAR